MIQNETPSQKVDAINKEIVTLGCKLRGKNLAFVKNSKEGKRIEVLRERRAALYGAERKAARPDRVYVKYQPEHVYGVRPTMRLPL